MLGARARAGRCAHTRARSRPRRPRARERPQLRECTTGHTCERTGVQACAQARRRVCTQMCTRARAGRHVRAQTAHRCAQLWPCVHPGCTRARTITPMHAHRLHTCMHVCTLVPVHAHGLHTCVLPCIDACAHISARAHAYRAHAHACICTWHTHSPAELQPHILTHRAGCWGPVVLSRDGLGTAPAALGPVGWCKPWGTGCTGREGSPAPLRGGDVLSGKHPEPCFATPQQRNWNYLLLFLLINLIKFCWCSIFPPY